MSLDAVLDKWLANPAAFAACFTLRDKDLTTIDFAPTGPQLQLFDALGQHKLLQVLKGRQIGRAHV